jgi:hypothetical protein
MGMSLFTTPETLPFGIAFALIVAIALIEGLGMLVSLSPSNSNCDFAMFLKNPYW